MYVPRLLSVAALLLAGAAGAAGGGFVATTPRPPGYAEQGAPESPIKVDFLRVQETLGRTIDIEAHFPGKAVAEVFRADEVKVNGTLAGDFVVRNNGAFSGNRTVFGTENFSVALYAGWEPGKVYEVVVTGVTASGKPVSLTAAGTSPASIAAVAGGSLGQPSAATPYHHITMTLAREVLAPGIVTRVDVDGKRVDGKFCSYARYFNSGPEDPRKAGKTEGLKGESFKGRIDGARDFEVTAPCVWTNGSKHAMRVTAKFDSGEEKVFESEFTAGAAGGYWNGAWPYSVSIVAQETTGLGRRGEPIHVTVGLFADTVSDPARELRVVTYSPTDPKAGADGYVVAPFQAIDVAQWHDKKLLAFDERDAKTGEHVHRYDATTTVELVFFADVLPYEEKVYQILYGNPAAEALTFDTDLSVVSGDGLAQTVSNGSYAFALSSSSGSVETITVRGAGEPVLLEHKLETNGAVHWNPDCYVPPTPWVHASDWEKPDFEQITGPLMHRTRRYAALPHLDAVTANVSYTFYAGQPYVLMSSLMELKKEVFVQALRNSEIVFNHAVLDEFVWEDALGTIQARKVSETREHPIHGIEIPADTPWMALISRKHGVGFAAITLAYENTNVFGDPSSETQPYIYVQNGPWVYWARGLVYPFGGQNLTRLMRARKGSLYFEKTAWVPFRLANGGEPFADIVRTRQLLTHPLIVREWMDIDARTPDKWVMPILTMPFDEGVAGAVSAHKKKEN